MQHVASLFDHFFILIDALNETDEHGAILSFLVDLCINHKNIRVLATCTREPQPTHPLISIRPMSPVAVDLDIDSYVLQRLSTEPSFRSLSAKIKDEIKERVVSGSHGM
jgi:hypothetical protein